MAACCPVSSRVGLMLLLTVSFISSTLSSAQSPLAGLVTEHFDFSAADLASNRTLIKLGPRRSFSTSNDALHINAAAAPLARRGTRNINVPGSLFSNVGVIYAQLFKFQDAATGSLAAFDTQFSFSLTHGGKASASKLASSNSTAAATAPPGTWLAFVITPRYSRSKGVPLKTAFAVQFGDEETTQSIADLDDPQHHNANVVRVQIAPGSLGTRINPSIEYDPVQKKLRVWISYGDSKQRELKVSIDNKAFNFSGDYMYVGLVAGRAPAPRPRSPARFWKARSLKAIQNLHGWRMSTSISQERVATISPNNNTITSFSFHQTPNLDPAYLSAAGFNAPGPGVSAPTTPGPNEGIREYPMTVGRDCNSFSCSKIIGITGLAVGGVILIILLAFIAIGCFLHKKGVLILKQSGDAANSPEFLVRSMGAYGQRIFTYKELEAATKAFSPACLLGVGGSGSVYRGIVEDPLDCNYSSAGVAVKVISGNSMQGKKEFLSELSTISQVRHRNIVTLRGWCDSQAQNGKLLLVYDYMPHGSLDQLLFSKNPRSELRWETRFRILLGVASALSYLHEEWEQQILHRDVKASNIMLDANYNARLGDFGVAKLVEHNRKTQISTVLVTGTAGYMAPEMAYTRKSTDKTDVYSFGALALEVACGRRPLELDYPKEETMLLDWVWRLQAEDRLGDAVDERLNDDYSAPQMLRVLQVGLLCSYREPDLRPSMRQALHFLKGDIALPALPRTRPRAQDSVLPMTLADLLEEHSVNS